MATAWIRHLTITMSSEQCKKQVIFGNSDDTNLTISVTGTKYLSPLKDEFVVKIKNIPIESSDDETASQVAIVKNGFRYIRIEAGYKDAHMEIFNGYVVYCHVVREDNNTTTSMIITCSGYYMYANALHMNFTLKSGTSYYSAIWFAARRAGIQDIQISNTLKHRFLKKDTAYDGTLSSLLIQLQDSDYKILMNQDYTSKSVLNVWDGTILSKRVVNLTAENIILSNGYPTIENEGISFHVLPFFNFMPGDVVIMTDETFINKNISGISAYESDPEPEHYIDAEGKYIIKELQYNLENRGSNFDLTLKCYSASLYQSITKQDVTS